MDLAVSIVNVTVILCTSCSVAQCCQNYGTDQIYSCLGQPALLGFLL